MTTEPITRKAVRTASTKKRRLRITLISIASVLGVVIAGVGIYAFSLAQQFDSVEKIEDVFPDDALRPPAGAWEGPAPQNILLLGSDTRGAISGSLASAAGNRSDTMMVVHIAADRQSIQVMSLMRDFWVDIPGRGKAKLNAALAYGGVPLTVQTIEGLIGARIDHVAIVDFQGFMGITNAVGGVTVDNAVAFNPRFLRGQRFEKGEITLNGEQALAFVRERYAFTDGDYQRVRNQQAFIKGMMSKVLSAETLTNPITISNLVSAVAPYMAVDKDFNAGYAASLGFELRDIRVKDVRFFTMPTLGTGRQGSQSVVNIDWDEVPKIQKAFQDDTLVDYEVPKK